MGTLKDRYCVVGVGETEYSRNSGRTTRAMAVEAIRKAMDDAGLGPKDVDGMMSYQGNDSTPSLIVGPDLAIRLNFWMDVVGDELSGRRLGGVRARRHGGEPQVAQDPLHYLRLPDGPQQPEPPSSAAVGQNRLRTAATMSSCVGMVARSSESL